MNSVTFVVPGKPVPKGRPRAVVRGGFARLYTPKTTKQYEAQIAEVARIFFPTPLTGDITLEVHAYCGGRQPDLDNIFKAVADALNGIAYNDDRQIVCIFGRRHKCKAVAEQRVEITVREDGAA